MKKYGNDYRQNGKKFDYVGDWYECSLDAAALKKQAVRYFAEMAAALALFIAGLSLNNLGGSVFYVLMPYAFLIFPIFYGLMGGAALYSFCRRLEGKKTQEVIIPSGHTGHMMHADYEKGVLRPARSSMGVAVLSGIALAGDLILLIQHPDGLILSRELIFAAAAALLLAIGIITCRQTRRIKDATRKL